MHYGKETHRISVENPLKFPNSVENPRKGDPRISPRKISVDLFHGNFSGFSPEISCDRFPLKFSVENPLRKFCGYSNEKGRGFSTENPGISH